MCSSSESAQVPRHTPDVSLSALDLTMQQVAVHWSILCRVIARSCLSPRKHLHRITLLQRFRRNDSCTHLEQLRFSTASPYSSPNDPFRRIFRISDSISGHASSFLEDILGTPYKWRAPTPPNLPTMNVWPTRQHVAQNSWATDGSSPGAYWCHTLLSAAPLISVSRDSLPACRYLTEVSTSRHTRNTLEHCSV